MNHSILLVIPKPVAGNDEIQKKWGTAIDYISDIIQKNKGIQSLAENVLLLSLDNELDALGQVTRRLEHVDYNYLILEQKEIVWHQVSKKA